MIRSAWPGAIRRAKARASLSRNCPFPPPEGAGQRVPLSQTGVRSALSRGFRTVACVLLIWPSLLSAVRRQMTIGVDSARENPAPAAGGVCEHGSSFLGATPCRPDAAPATAAISPGRGGRARRRAERGAGQAGRAGTRPVVRLCVGASRRPRVYRGARRAARAEFATTYMSLGGNAVAGPAISGRFRGCIRRSVLPGVRASRLSCVAVHAHRPAGAAAQDGERGRVLTTILEAEHGIPAARTGTSGGEPWGKRGFRGRLPRPRQLARPGRAGHAAGARAGRGPATVRQRRDHPAGVRRAAGRPVGPDAALSAGGGLLSRDAVPAPCAAGVSGGGAAGNSPRRHRAAVRFCHRSTIAGIRN